MKDIVFGLILSGLYSKIFLPKNEGEYPNFIRFTFYPFVYKGMIIIPYNKKKALHIHHWISCLTILILKLIINISDFFTGFLLGLFLQGISYSDRFKFIRANPYI